MCFWLVSDGHLSSFHHRRGTFFPFSQSTPSQGAGVTNHKNIVLFHFLFNGTKKGASGPLRIFETWFRPYRCADLLIDDSVFGMDAADTQALLEPIRAIQPNAASAPRRERALPP